MNFLQFPKVNTSSIESIPTGRCNEHNLLTSWRKLENSIRQAQGLSDKRFTHGDVKWWNCNKAGSDSAILSVWPAIWVKEEEKIKPWLHASYAESNNNKKSQAMILHNARTLDRQRHTLVECISTGNLKDLSVFGFFYSDFIYEPNNNINI